MNFLNKPLYKLLTRYLLLLLLGLGNLYLFYKLLSPLTIYPVFFLLKIFYNVTLSNDSILYNNHSIQIISACVAASAFYLLTILNLTTPMKNKQRLYSLTFSLSTLLIINIIRIFFLSILIIRESVYFDVTHKIFWYGLSTIFVIALWFLSVKLFKINSIPIYSDFKKLIKEVHL